jgi:uncharacterized membrane protein YdjX (TVP38/TMEM64 family)
MRRSSPLKILNSWFSDLLTRKKVIHISVLCAVIAAAGLFFFYYEEVQSLVRIALADPQRLRQIVADTGDHGWIIFVALQAMQVVIAPLPGEITGAAGGYLFGAGLGFLLATAGILLGSVISFVIGRFVARALIADLIGDERLKQLQNYLDRPNSGTILSLFFMPGFPKDVLNYVVALGNRPAFPYLITSNVARMPGTLLLTMTGSALFEESSSKLFTIGAVVVSIMFLAKSLRKK